MRVVFQVFLNSDFFLIFNFIILLSFYRHSIIKKVSKRNDKVKMSKRVKIEDGTKEAEENEESYEDEFEEFEPEEESVNEATKEKSLEDQAKSVS